MKLLGIDTGGTFTDFVAYENGRLVTHKRLSTPDAPERAILEGMRDLGVRPSDAFALAHGTTVGTNAVLEHKGARTAYVTNRGFADTLTIGRQTRDALYDLTPSPTPPPVPRELCLETGGRMDPRGDAVDNLSDADLEALLKQIAALAPEAVAINLLFSFVDARFERAIESALAARFPDLFVSRSSTVLPQYGEYERGVATWLNSYTGPVLQSYIRRLRDRLSGGVIRLMQSDGRMLAADKVGEYAVRMLLSGPAGGVTAMAHVGKTMGRDRLLGFDMGGTSTDVSMIDGEIELTDTGNIARHPVAVPMIDIHTIGSGGGSIAALDAGGLLRVGPASAGAHPGPACYGRGGRCATVTDANFILGRLPDRLGDSLTLDRDAATQAIRPIADALGVGVEDAARGVIKVVDEQMIQALKVMSVHRGKDPEQCLLFGFGAAGGLHICALADGLRIKEAVVPAHAGVFSALGMLLAPQGVHMSHAVCAAADDTDDVELNARFDALAEDAARELREQGVEPGRTARHVDLRYRGQSQCLRLERRPVKHLVRNFHDAHARLYDYALDLPVEIVSLHVSAEAPAMLDRKEVRAKQNEAPQTIKGPRVVPRTDGTVYVAEGWSARTDDRGHLRLSRTSAS